MDMLDLHGELRERSHKEWQETVGTWGWQGMLCNRKTQVYHQQDWPLIQYPYGFSCPSHSFLARTGGCCQYLPLCFVCLREKCMKVWPRGEAKYVVGLTDMAAVRLNCGEPRAAFSGGR